MQPKIYRACLFVLTLCFGANTAMAEGTLQSLEKCLDVFGNTDVDGSKVVLYDCNGQANQDWRFEGDGVLKQIVGLGEKCLVPGAVGSTGETEMVIGPCEGAQQELFSISGDFPETFSLVHNATGSCLDVYDEMTANETPIVLFPCHGNANQTWSFDDSTAPVPLPGLLLPFYVVDRNFSTAPTTLFAVRNGRDEAVTVRYEYYGAGQALGNPEVTETLSLPANGVRTINLRNIVGLPVDPTTDLSTGYAAFTIIDPATMQPTQVQDLNGDYFLLDAFNNFASGDILLDTSTEGEARNLCNRWDLRFFNGGSFTGGTTFTFFVENNPGGTTPVAIGKVYSESGTFVQEVALTTPENAFQVSSFSLGLGTNFGAIEWSFAEGIRGHVSGTFRANGLYSVGLPAVCKD